MIRSIPAVRWCSFGRWSEDGLILWRLHDDWKSASGGARIAIDYRPKPPPEPTPDPFAKLWG